MVNDVETNSSPATRSDLLRRWHVQATAWATEQAMAWLATKGAPATAGVIMDHLDSLPAPAGYEMMRKDYIKRYHFVRRVMKALHSAQQVTTVPVVNSRGRSSLAYAIPGTQEAPKVRRRKRTTSQYEVLVEGAPEVKAKLEAFLESTGLGSQPFEAFIVKK